MSTRTKKAYRTPKEAGMVAIMVTMILMIVISLIVLGFAQISRRNQRQALDRQLSTQAFYAAETGVNDTANIIETAAAAGNSISNKDTCASNGGGFYAGLNPTLDATTNTGYTCVTVDPSPSSLVYNNITTTSTIVPLHANAGTISSIRLTWTSKEDTVTPSANCPTSANNVFSTTANWLCGYGVLRIDLVPVGGGMNFNSLRTATMTSFLVPQRVGGTNTANYAAGGNNNRIGVRCNNTDCNLNISGGLGGSSYYMRVSSLYKDVALSVNATNPAGGTVELTGAQALIDSTGKAQDVLRRIQVRVPLAGSSRNLLSDYAILSTDAICKRFAVMDGYFQSSANTAVPGVGPANPGNPLCQ
ncbi:MAG TPA: pilus assembly PilX N-terminal domain-containing protein [Candidatus Saccharimonadales bacterium]|nr:pilus assembly PilX N-terminal domain-containing protein [Candidatus Saccharimonadales bacterium]